jgi:hypothetical protein
MKSILGRGMDSCGSGYDLVAGVYEHGIKSLSPVKGGTRQAGVASILKTSLREVFGSNRGRETCFVSTKVTRSL